MRELVARYLSHSISRRTFLKGLTTTGISLTAARSILDSLVPAAHAQAGGSGPANKRTRSLSTVGHTKAGRRGP